jgi:hypothetical protein
MSVEKILVDNFEVLEYNGVLGVKMPLNDEPCKTGEFIYDGRNCAILVRNETKAFIFTNILTEIREKVLNAPSIMMIETDGEEVVNSYMVDVVKVDEIPYEDTIPKVLQEVLRDIKEIYGQEGVKEIAANFWGIK